MKAIDTSYCQGAVDFNAVKADGIEGVILRCGYGRSASQEDRAFKGNYDRAINAGMHIGAYHYSYCESVEDARSEAKACIEILGDRKFDLPIYFDVEEPSILSRGKDFVSECITVFCTELEKAGYFAGFYTSKSVLENLVHKEVAERFSVWMALWSDKDTYKGQHGAWQYSEKGAVRGVIGYVDMDIIYEDYPSIIVNGGFNNFPKKQESSSVSENDSSGSVTVEKPVESVEKPVENVEKPVKKPDTVNYTIQPGDTLWGISKKYRTTVKKLKELNPQIEDVNLIYAGDVINVPNRGGSEND